MDYRSAFNCIKWDMLSLLFMISSTVTLYPGTIFTLTPPTVMSRKTFVNYTNLLVSMAYIVGRLTSGFEFNHLAYSVNQAIGAIIMCGLLAIYFLGLETQFEGVFFSVIVL